MVVLRKRKGKLKKTPKGKGDHRFTTVKKKDIKGVLGTVFLHGGTKGQ